MATTTSNFGWPIPQSTDLVKDGATAIASLGSGVDTSMAELKGGTTGQILSKTSNTDMDFTWINNDQGDITGVTAGTGLTGGGTSGSVTLDFDVANYGGGQYAAGKNKLINGDFGIWQRGTSTTLTTGTGAFSSDRWFALCNFSAGTATASQQTFTAGTAPVAGYEGTYFQRITTGSTATYIELSQKIEDVRQFAGQTVTLSFWAKASTAMTSGLLFRQDFGSGGSAVVDTSGSNASITTSWTRFTSTVSIPSISGKTIGTGSSLRIYPISISGTFSSATVDIWGVQLEAGSTATPFQTATGTIQGELAACQRYYWRTTTSAIYNTLTGSNGATSTTQVYGQTKNPVTMRVAPSTIDYSTTYSNYQLHDAANNNIVVTGLGIDANACSIDYAGFYATGSGLTQFRTYVLQAANSNGAYLGFGAEL